MDNTASGTRDGIRRLKGDCEMQLRQVEELRRRRERIGKHGGKS